MTALIVRRLLTLPVLVLFASVLVFLMPYLAGIDPERAIIRARIGDRSISAEAAQSLSAELGLDRPLPVQYAAWLGQVARGDLGFSYVSRAPVSEILARGMRTTALLAGSVIGIAFVLALPLGIFAAQRPTGFVDTFITMGSQVGIAMPEYWLGPLLVLVFSLQLGWLPSSGWRGPEFALLPIMTMMLRPMAYFTQMVRTTMIEVNSSAYIRTARSKGLREWQVTVRHALPNCLIPVITLVSIWLAGLLGGSVIVEVIFVIPGMGRIMYEAALASDIPLLQAGLLLMLTLVVAVNAMTDILYVVLNPAIRPG